MKLLQEQKIKIKSTDVSESTCLEKDIIFNQNDISIIEKIWLKNAIIRIEFIGNIPTQIFLRFKKLDLSSLSMSKSNPVRSNTLEVDVFHSFAYDFTRLWCYPDNIGYIEFISFIIDDKTNSEYEFTLSIFSRVDD